MERKHGVLDKSSYLTYSCEKCEDAFKSKSGLKFHVEAKHTTCKTLKSAMKTERKKKTFMDDIKKDIEGDATAEQINTDLNTLMNGSPSIREENMIKVMRKIAIMKVVDHSDKVASKDNDVETNTNTATIFISHHEEENSNDSQIEVNPWVWELFHSEEEVKSLTEEEKKEVLKLHKYFAHRNARKLWTNLLQPAGRMKGKKEIDLGVFR